MGEEVALFRPSFNAAVKVETRTERLSGDAGYLLLREAMKRTGIIDYLCQRLSDPRDRTRIEHSMAELLRASLAMIAQGWIDQADAARLRDDPLLSIAGSDRRGLGAGGKALASQASFSRLLDRLAGKDNAAIIDAAPLRLAATRIRSANRSHLPRLCTIDIDGLPLPAHGHQAGSAFNGHVGARIHYPLIASCAESGDMLAALLREGNAGPAKQAAQWIPKLVSQAQGQLARKIQVRLDAGFTDGKTLAALDEHGIDYVGRQTLLSLRLLAYQLMHVLRCLLERATKTGWSLRRLRERILKSAARVQGKARELVVILERRAAKAWRKLLPTLERLKAAPG